MKKLEKALTVAVIVTIFAIVIGFLIMTIFNFFGNPLERKRVRTAAEKYIALNYGEYNPKIVDIDYDFKYIPYHVEVLLEGNGKTFWLLYYGSGELAIDDYDWSEYERKYGEAYYEDGIYGIRDIIGIPQNEKQKAVIAVINFDFEIQNGGLAQYLINEENEYIVNIVEYLRMLGAEEQAKLLEEFTTENGVELKAVETSSIDESIEFEKSKPFDKFNDAYMEIYIPEGEYEPYLNFLIINYIQDHIEDF